MDAEPCNPFVTSGLDAVKFILVRSSEDIGDEDQYFKPDMCHQVFGESESIFGYKGLEINVMYNANTFQCFIADNYKEKFTQIADSPIEAEDYRGLLEGWLPDNLLPRLGSFIETMDPVNRLPPFGTFFKRFSISSYEDEIRTFEVYECRNDEPGYKEFHNRMQTIIIWFIDAANYIDVDDEKWTFLILYEKVMKGNRAEYFPVGYTTIYEYFAYPDRKRYRISQFIVFPPYQNIGLGTEFLRIVYVFLSNLPMIKDFTVEDPSDKFQSIRDYVDVRICLNTPGLCKYVTKGKFNHFSHELEILYKINVNQCKRLFEILRLYLIDQTDIKQMKGYELTVKYRLNLKSEKTGKRGGPVDKDDDQKNKMIETQYQELVSQYRRVIKRLTRVLDDKD